MIGPQRSHHCRLKRPETLLFRQLSISARNREKPDIASSGKAVQDKSRNHGHSVMKDWS